MRTRYLLLLCAALFFSAGTVAAQRGGIMLRVSTFGVGADVAYAVTPAFNVRANFSYLPISEPNSILGYVENDQLTAKDHEVEGLVLGYEEELTVGSAGLFADFHPGGRFFHITGGLRVNLNKVNASVRSQTNYVLEDGGQVIATFTPDQIGGLGVEVDYPNPIAPYLGIGVGNVTKGRVGMNFQIGVNYVGSPEVTVLTDEGALLGVPANFVENVNSELADLAGAKFWPVVSLGITLGVGAQ